MCATPPPRCVNRTSRKSAATERSSDRTAGPCLGAVPVQSATRPAIQSIVCSSPISPAARRRIGISSSWPPPRAVTVHGKWNGDFTGTRLQRRTVGDRGSPDTPGHHRGHPGVLAGAQRVSRRRVGGRGRWSFERGVGGRGGVPDHSGRSGSFAVDRVPIGRRVGGWAFVLVVPPLPLGHGAPLLGPQAGWRVGEEARVASARLVHAESAAAEIGHDHRAPPSAPRCTSHAPDW